MFLLNLWVYIFQSIEDRIALESFGKVREYNVVRITAQCGIEMDRKLVL